MSPEPLSAQRPIFEALALYRRYPFLFLVLAAGVIVPYETVVLAITGSGPFAQGSLGFGTSSLLTLIDWTVFAPLVSALHVHAVADTREGKDPRLAPVALRGLRVLPVVVAASIISGLGIAVGLFLLVVPGILLAIRWAVVAQTAAIEHEGWLPALRRGAELTKGNYGRLFLFLMYVALIGGVPTVLVGLAFGHTTTTAASFLVGVALRVLTSSFAALATALLYFELRARAERGPATAQMALREGPSAATDHSLDPRRYTDEERPKGWYIDPASPRRMVYWQDGESPGWTGNTKTPRKLRRTWAAESGDETSERS